MKSIFSILAILVLANAADAGAQTSCKMPGNVDVNVVLADDTKDSFIEVVYSQENTYTSLIKALKITEDVEVVRGVTLNVVTTSVVSADGTLIKLTSIGGNTMGDITGPLTQHKVVALSNCRTDTIWDR